MKTWIVSVVAVEAWLGNPSDPLLWHFSVAAKTAAEAIAQLRSAPDIPKGAQITAQSLGVTAP